MQNPIAPGQRVMSRWAHDCQAIVGPSAEHFLDGADDPTGGESRDFIRSRESVGVGVQVDDAVL
jgi:hypothetical protein